MAATKYVALMAVLATVFLAATSAHSRAKPSPDPRVFAERLQQALVEGDRRFVIDHLSEAVYFLDDGYRKKEVIALLEDEKSWLNQDLFTDPDSVRADLAGANAVTIYVHAFGMFKTVVFVPENSTKPSSPQFTVYWKKGRWRITNIDFN